MEDDKIKDWIKKNSLQFLIYLAIFSFAAYKIIENIADKNEVRNNYQVTVGEIVEYKVFGVGPNRYLTYEYIVNGKKYKREINGPNRIFDECADGIAFCSDKSFLVVYSRINPSKSMINLTREIQDTEDIELPKSLKSFQ